VYLGPADVTIKTFQDLYDWSVSDRRNEFWADAWETAGMIHEGSYKHVRSTSLLHLCVLHTAWQPTPDNDLGCRT